jgi:hypothetical protein
MARTVSEISESIRERFSARLTLSASGVAEWKLWVSVCATAIHVFEIILDKFKSDVEGNVMTSRPGTRKWYERLCFMFQNGHELIFDEKDAVLKYRTDDPDARITAVAAVQENDGVITLRVAKKSDNAIVPFGDMERLNFTNYINESKPLGSKTVILSTAADKVRFSVQVFYNPAFALELIREQTEKAMDSFKTDQQFGGILYPERFVDYLINVVGVITVKLDSFSRKGTSDGNFIPVNISARLEAGYFNYDDDNCIITYQAISIL